MERAYGLEIPQTLAETIHSSRAALLVYDMQVGILKQLPDGRSVLQQVLKVLSAARDGGIRTFFCRHLSLPKEAAGVSQLRMAMAWQHVASVAEVRAHLDGRCIPPGAGRHAVERTPALATGRRAGSNPR